MSVASDVSPVASAPSLPSPPVLVGVALPVVCEALLESLPSLANCSYCSWKIPNSGA